ncbi:type I-D CRISPR-associated helicase Cas3' [Fuchsiella alkaliacetigena]|uniref:type I-D CRISPR-associated helicase Cas3' n=1 Tax=Fuchsiella alkaliacetigena TaxID=957042 RepID=UPI00200A15AF|nr:type I-D CRISPR-associated helicase Cas3' [Fuchsiella alkaliacetigena]MCK8825371.1 type I-D CRISPR-associated helicase Cas3' [Fuchsiella alkaliacetigena]
MKIEAYEVGQVEHENFTHIESDWKPYIHQALIYDYWDKAEGFLVTTKTGSGKTISASYPIVSKGESAFLVYPTNALIDDQVSSIQQMLKEFKYNFYYYNPNEEYDNVKANNAEVILIKIDSDSLTKYQKENRFSNKGKALNYLVSTNKPTLLLTNPDTLFLILALRYSQGMEIWGHLSRFDTLVIDEFHLYGGIELAHILFMIEYSKEIGFFEKFVLLSATPDSEIKELLDSILEIKTINPDCDIDREIVSQRKVAFPIELTPSLIYRGKDVVSKALKIVKNKIRIEHITDLYCENCNEDYVPLVVIFNSVINAIRFEDRLAKIIDRDKMGIFRGLSDRSIRSFKNKLIVIGTSAIEVGIDFKCDYLIFEAGDKASFMQRFGRIGRHASGETYLLCSHNVYQTLKEEEQLSRNQFEHLINQLYSKVDARPWFAKTFSGVFAVYALTQRLVKLVTGDRNTIEEVNNEVKETANEILTSYVEKIGAKREYKRLQLMLKRLKKHKFEAFEWMTTYMKNMSFRSSLVNLEVFDVIEEERREGKGSYNADLKTVLARGKNLSYDVKENKVTLAGYESKYKDIEVFINLYNFSYGSYNLLSNFSDTFSIECDGQYSPLTNKLLENDHIFTIVPQWVLQYVDWRILTFKCLQGLIAFDETALLLSEVYEKYK